MRRRRQEREGEGEGWDAGGEGLNGGRELEWPLSHGGSGKLRYLEASNQHQASYSTRHKPHTSFSRCEGDGLSRCSTSRELRKKGIGDMGVQ